MLAIHTSKRFDVARRLTGMALDVASSAKAMAAIMISDLIPAALVEAAIRGGCVVFGMLWGSLMIHMLHVKTKGKYL